MGNKLKSSTDLKAYFSAAKRIIYDINKLWVIDEI